MAFDWSHQIAKRICNEGAALDQWGGSMEQKKIENRKFYEILTLVTSETIKFYDFSSLTRISLLPAFALHIIM